MVRYDKCVENIYDNGVQMEDKTKTLNILKVMKGAISMSKSKTGECIFRNNKTEKTNLAQTIKRHRRDNVYNVARIDTNKKLLVGRWTKILERQTTVSAQSLFEEMLDIQSPTGSDADDHKLKSYISMRLEKIEESISGPKLSFKRGPRRRASEFLLDQRSDGTPVPSNSTEAFVSEKKEIRDKYADDATPATNSSRQDVSVLSKSAPLKLPSIGVGAGFRRLDGVGKGNNEDEEKKEAVVDEQDLSDWREWRLKDKNWIIGYIHNEKTRQEDLIIRNALNKIENEMSGANTIKRHQIKQKLQNERAAEKRRERELRQLTMASKSPSLVSSPRSHVTSSSDTTTTEPIIRSITFSNRSKRRSGDKKIVKILAPSECSVSTDEEEETNLDLTSMPDLPANFSHVANRKPSFVGQLPVIVEHPKKMREKSLPIT